MDWLYRGVYDVLSPSVGTIDFVELVWTTLAAVGLIVSIRGLGDALSDLRYVREFGDEARGIVAAGNVRHEIMRIFVQAELAAFGLLAMTLPDDRPIPLSAKALLAITISGCFAAVSILDREDRRRLFLAVRRSPPPLSIPSTDESWSTHGHSPGEQSRDPVH